MNKLLLTPVTITILLSILACSFPFSILNQDRQAAQATLYAQLFKGTPIPLSTLPDSEMESTPISQTEQRTTPAPLNGPSGKYEFPGLNIVPPPEMLASPYFDTTPVDRYLYHTQSGDTLSAILSRFNVPVDAIVSENPLPEYSYLPIGEQISIPNQFRETSLPYAIFPDSEVIYSPSAAGFDIAEYIQQAGGYLSRHSEKVDGMDMSGAEIITRLTRENSINPRLLLAFLEFHTQWVFESPSNPQLQYPIGFMAASHQGLYGELSLVIRQLTKGYYGWRKGDFYALLFGNQSNLQLYPELNPGSVAILNLFSRIYSRSVFPEKLYGDKGFISVYRNMFGDPWERAAQIEPLIPSDLAQPLLELPFIAGERWVMTGGPHNSWGVGSPYGGLDFAPSAVEGGCGVSRYWVTASAAGVVTRSENGVLVIDLDGDGFEQTGWTLVYLHIAQKDRPPVGARIEVDQPIGHPSCEGGLSSGTHVHISRKFNGEWLVAGSPVPFILSGWQASPGVRPYQGVLQKDDKIVSARSDGSSAALIIR